MKIPIENWCEYFGEFESTAAFVQKNISWAIKAVVANQINQACSSKSILLLACLLNLSSVFEALEITACNQKNNEVKFFDFFLTTLTLHSSTRTRQRALTQIVEKFKNRRKSHPVIKTQITRCWSGDEQEDPRRKDSSPPAPSLSRLGISRRPSRHSSPVASTHVVDQQHLRSTSSQSANF